MRFEEPFFSGYVGEVRAWASQFAAENRIAGWVNAHYIWPDELRGIWDQLGDTRGGLIGIVGLQGVGKSSALQAIYRSRIEQDDAQRAQDPEAKAPLCPSYLRDVLLFKWRRQPELFTSLLNGSHEASDTFLSRYLPLLWHQSSRTSHPPHATSPRHLREKLQRMLDEMRVLMRDASNNPDSGAVVTFSASPSDLVDGSVPVTCTPASGSTFPVRTTSVSCSATDNAGNSASGSFKVTVQAVTVKLLASSGSGLSGAVVQYYSGGWKPFGTTGSDGTVSMALSPGPYIFQITYAGASEQKTQNVATDPNVAFQTVQVHSDSGKCTSYIQVATVPTRYHAVGWQTFTQDMELLPGTYMFRFSDGTANTSYTLVVGAIKHIH